MNFFKLPGLIFLLLIQSHLIRAGEIVIQPGPEGSQDIWTTSIFSYARGGGGPGGGLDDHRLLSGGWGDLYYSLIKFDISNAPANVDSATVELFAGIEKGEGTTGIYVDRITESWEWKIEGTGSDNERLWWADRPNAVFVQGVLPAPILGQWYTIDITDLYNNWKTGVYPNHGIQLRPQSIANRWNVFYSSEYADDPSLRPKLVLTYPGSVCAPEFFRTRYPLHEAPIITGPWGGDAEEVKKSFKGHLGVDYRAAVGTPVLSTACGTVCDINLENKDNGKKVGWGNYVLIHHTLPDGTGRHSLYTHLSTVTVEMGQEVAIGQEIGLSGDSGGVAPHLHFQIIDDKQCSPGHGYLNQSFDSSAQWQVKGGRTYFKPSAFIEKWK